MQNNFDSRRPPRQVVRAIQPPPVQPPATPQFVYVMQAPAEQKHSGHKMGVTDYVILALIAVVIGWIVWPKQTNAFLANPAQAVQTVVGNALQPGTVTGPKGELVGCAEGGTFISFANDLPNFVNPADGTMNGFLPTIGTSPQWYCYDQPAWKKFLNTPKVLDALVINILNHSGLKGPQWEQAVRDALKASMSSPYLFLPSKTGQAIQTPLVVPPNPPGGGGGGGQPPAATQPPGLITATPTPSPTATRTLGEEEKARFDAVIAEVLPGQQITGDGDALYVLTFTWEEMISLTGQAAVLPRLSTSGAFYNNGALWSEAVTVDGKRIFKAPLSIQTSVPGGGTWMSPFNVRWSPTLSDGTTNTWGKDSSGYYEAQVRFVYLYPVIIPTPKPKYAAPPVVPTMEPTAIAAVQQFLPTAEPTATKVPVVPISYISYIGSIPASGQYGVKSARCSQYEWPSSTGVYIALCESGGKWIYVDWSVNMFGDMAINWSSWSIGSGMAQYPGSCKQQGGVGPWFACP